jgi:hypothetical protein
VWWALFLAGRVTCWQGGGWCYDEVDCYCRSQMHYGSSSLLPKSINSCKCMNPLPSGEMDDCNCIFLPYLDGASFSGFRAAPVPVPAGGPDRVPENATVTFRGIKNLDAALDWSFAHSDLDEATEVVLTGISAGGLSTFLHADRVGARVRAGAPGCTVYKAAPQVL